MGRCHRTAPARGLPALPTDRAPLTRRLSPTIPAGETPAARHGMPWLGWAAASPRRCAGTGGGRDRELPRDRELRGLRFLPLAESRLQALYGQSLPAAISVSS